MNKLKTDLSEKSDKGITNNMLTILNGISLEKCLKILQQATVKKEQIAITKEKQPKNKKGH